MPHIMIVVSPYYKDVADNLLQGSKATLETRHATYEVFEVSGALEIPLAIKYGCMRGQSKDSSHLKFDGFIALGCIIRGETSHYDIVCNESARGLLNLSLEYNVPIGNAILTCDNMDQAVVRADPAQKNKGADACNAVFSLLDIKRECHV